MKKSITFLILFTLFLSCKKDEESPAPSTIPTDYRCTGNNSSSYFPLAIDNAWTFPRVSVNYTIHDYKINRNVSFNSMTYFELFDTDGSVEANLRTDSNGDIVIFDPTSGNEFLYIPAAPLIGQSWGYAWSMTRQVILTSVTVTTTHCTYDDCLLIRNCDSSGDPNHDYYYKKGYGLIRHIQYNTGTSNFTFDLEHLILK